MALDVLPVTWPATADATVAAAILICVKAQKDFKIKSVCGGKDNASPSGQLGALTAIETSRKRSVTHQMELFLTHMNCTVPELNESFNLPNRPQIHILCVCDRAQNENLQANSQCNTANLIWMGCVSHWLLLFMSAC